MVEPAPRSQRLAVRFGATLLANATCGVVNFATGLLVARGLGAVPYGDYAFLVASFLAIVQLLDMGASDAFYTFLSRRPRGARFLAAYWTWMLLQFAAVTLFVALVPGPLFGRIWLGHDRGTVLLAFAAVFCMTQLWSMLSQLGEAARRTVVVQVASVSQSLMQLALVAAAFRLGRLSVSAVLAFIVGEYVLLTVVLAPRLAAFNRTRATEENLRSIVRQFRSYCAPLVVYAWGSFAYAFADRWLLQRFGGARQQGFFAISQQFATIAQIATTSILRVFWKEIAEAKERGDAERVRRFYATVCRSLYATAVVIGAAFVPYTGEVLQLTVGGNFSGAWLAMAVMFLYPMHQSLGQITSAFLHATGDTRRYATIGLSLFAVSIPVTYLVLAPATAAVPGLGLGAIGLAVKLVILQIVGVNIQMAWIAHHGVPYDKLFQLLVPTVFLTLSFACRGILAVVAGGLAPVATAGLGIVAYGVAAAAVLYARPDLSGLGDVRLRAIIRGALTR